MNYHLYTNSDIVDGECRRVVDVYFYPISVAIVDAALYLLDRERLQRLQWALRIRKQKSIKKIECGNIPAIVLGYPLPKKLDKRNQHPKRKLDEQKV